MVGSIFIDIPIWKIRYREIEDFDDEISVDWWFFSESSRSASYPKYS